MRKPLLLFIFLLSWTWVLTAQGSFSIENAERYKSGIITEDITAGAHIRNNSDTDKRVKVRSEIVYMPEGGKTYFCWKECYTPAVTDSPEYIEIPAGESVKNFYGYYRPNEIVGEARVRFIFYSNNNPADSIHLVITFNAVPSGLKNLTLSRLEAYPNPASDEVIISYSRNTANEGWIDLYNMLGNKIQSVRISGNEGFARLETSGLKSGIYFYSLRGVSKPQRITIKH